MTTGLLLLLMVILYVSSSVEKGVVLCVQELSSVRTFSLAAQRFEDQVPVHGRHWHVERPSRCEPSEHAVAHTVNHTFVIIAWRAAALLNDMIGGRGVSDAVAFQYALHVKRYTVRGLW